MRAAYEKLDTDSMAEIDKLIRSKRCFAPRVDGLLTRVVEMLNQWNEAELKYWTVWADAEADRVASQQKSLASMEQEMKRADDLIVSTTKDREDLLRQKANLEKAGRAQTEGIRKQIDSLILDIKDSEARLADAQKNYEEVSSKVTSIKASLQARLIEMRQNKRSVEAYGLDMNSYYQSVRAAEQEICNTSQPGTLKQKQLPSSKPKAQP